jgi:hypothetical protein
VFELIHAFLDLVETGKLNRTPSRLDISNRRPEHPERVSVPPGHHAILREAPNAPKRGTYARRGRRCRRTASHLSLVQLPLVVTATVLIRRPPSYCRTCRPSHTGYSKIPERRESFEQAFPDVEIERPEGQSRFRMGQSRSGNRARRLAPVLADPPALNSAVAANANVWSLVRHAAAARAPLVWRG